MNEAYDDLIDPDGIIRAQIRAYDKKHLTPQPEDKFSTSFVTTVPMSNEEYAHLIRDCSRLVVPYVTEWSKIKWTITAELCEELTV